MTTIADSESFRAIAMTLTEPYAKTKILPLSSPGENTERSQRSLTLRYERKMYLIKDTPDNRRYIGKYIEVFQFPDGRIEIRAAGVSLPYSTYNKVGTIDHGDIVDNKRLSQVLRTAQIVQSQRDDRIVCRPSTAHRVDGTPIARNKIAGAKRQRDLSEDDLHDAIKSTHAWPKAGKRSNVLASPKADISN
jgi:hypothetical protein